MIFQRHRYPEHRHQAVTGELFDGATVTPYHCRRTVDELAQDLA